MDLTMPCPSLSLLFFISLHIHFLVPASGYFKPFQDCVPYRCGDQEINYPFRHNKRPNHCGYPGYELSCDGESLTLSMESLEYRVIHMDRRAQILEVVRTDITKDICLQTYVDTTLNCSLFNYAFTYLHSALFYNCNSSFTLQPYHRFSCPASGDGYFAPYVDFAYPLYELCNFSVLVPISPREVPRLPPPWEGGNDSATISEILNDGFKITWTANTSLCENCTKSGGRCGYDCKRLEFNCFCRDGAYSSTCNGTRVPGSFPSSMYALLSPSTRFSIS
ncbi:hypothetical protein BT93_B0660 [Corymbia citriodora subsp. variegata]|nr:hypothetical protein BT93_B0660 [Corymbia citriodora subsp. variegata]